MEIISSRTNETVKAAAALKETGERKKTGLFLLEGARLCCDAALNSVTVEKLFITERAAEKYPREFEAVKNKALKSYFITEHIAEKLSDTKNSQQFFAVCRDTKPSPVIEKDRMYVFCDNIQNPDNLGAIVRTAEALGVAGLIINSGCDIYSPKALRASMGALLRFPVIRTENGRELLETLRSAGTEIFGSVVSPDAEKLTETEKKGSGILVIGNEGNGISDEILSVCTKHITIPMKGKAESLNASAAATILIWEFMK